MNLQILYFGWLALSWNSFEIKCQDRGISKQLPVTKIWLLARVRTPQIAPQKWGHRSFPWTKCAFLTSIQERCPKCLQNQNEELKQIAKKFLGKYCSGFQEGMHVTTLELVERSTVTVNHNLETAALHFLIYFLFPSDSKKFLAISTRKSLTDIVNWLFVRLLLGINTRFLLWSLFLRDPTDNSVKAPRQV